MSPNLRLFFYQEQDHVLYNSYRIVSIIVLNFLLWNSTVHDARWIIQGPWPSKVAGIYEVSYFYLLGYDFIISITLVVLKKT